jgi:hypothetical protein
MNKKEDTLLKQEVEELTEMLLHDNVLEGLRMAIREKGMSPADMLLAGFIEDEEEREYGALVTKDGKVFEYERSTHLGKSGFDLFIEINNITLAIEHYPAVRIALLLVQDGIGRE